MESISRRNAIAALCASGFIAACGSGPLAGEPESGAAAVAAANGRALADGAMNDWAGIVGTVFDAGGGHSLKLVGVEPLPSSGVRPADVSRERAFIAVFDSIGGEMAGDLIYSIAASNYGPLDVFLAAAASPELPRRMHAVFN